MSKVSTFIDEAYDSVSSGEEFVQAMAEIYSHEEVRDILDEYPEWIKNIIIVIDYDTELQMEGLDFRAYDEEIVALKCIGLEDEADVLSLLLSDSTDEEISQCYDKLALNNDYDADMSYSEVAKRLTCLFKVPDITEYKGRYFEKSLIHMTLKGDLVRSKSEVIIANMLFEAGIEYEYEKELDLGEDGQRIPDFTIEDAESGICYYWEHCGMLGDC